MNNNGKVLTAGEMGKKAVIGHISYRVKSVIPWVKMKKIKEQITHRYSEFSMLLRFGW